MKSKVKFEVRDNNSSLENCKIKVGKIHFKLESQYNSNYSMTQYNFVQEQSGSKWARPNWPKWLAQ